MLKLNVRSISILAVLVALIAAPFFISNEYYITVLNSCIVASIVTIGLNFITGLTGQMNLGTAGIMALGAYSHGVLSLNFGVHPALALMLTLVIGFLIGLVLGYPSLRVSGVYLAITTIGFTEIVRILINNAEFTGGANGLRGIPKFRVFGFEFRTNTQIFYLLLAILILIAFIAHRIVASKWGRIFKALRDNPDAVEAGGVSLANLKIMAFTLASMIGCFGGGLYAILWGYISPSTFTQAYSTNFVLMLIIGGSGSVAGSIIGASLITMLPEVFKFMNNYYWLVTCIITLLFIVFMPEGIVSLFSRTNRNRISLKGRIAKYGNNLGNK